VTEELGALAGVALIVSLRSVFNALAARVHAEEHDSHHNPRRPALASFSVSAGAGKCAVLGGA
jgi:hypothetical protein